MPHENVDVESRGVDCDAHVRPRGVWADRPFTVLCTGQTVSQLQRLLPGHALGRVAATQSAIVLAAVPFGAALGGVIADSIGLRTTVLVAALGTVAAMVPLLRSRLWAYR